MSDFEINLNNIKYEFAELDALWLFDNIVKLFELQKSQSYRQGYNKGYDDAGDDHKNSYRQGFEDGKQECLKWLPIEQAPKDGTKVLVCGVNIEVAHYRNPPSTYLGDPNDYWVTHEGDYTCYAFRVTHFMPLPSPPQEQE